MKISYNWLKQFIKLPENAETTGELLTDLGLEVEGIDTFQSVKGGMAGVVVGHVLSCEAHPNADRLNLLVLYYMMKKVKAGRSKKGKFVVKKATE